MHVFWTAKIVIPSMLQISTSSSVTTGVNSYSQVIKFPACIQFCIGFLIHICGWMWIRSSICFSEMSWKRKSLGARVFTAKHNAQHHYPAWEPDEPLWWSWELYLTWENVLETERRKILHCGVSGVSNNHHVIYIVCTHTCSAWNITPHF